MGRLFFIKILLDLIHPISLGIVLIFYMSTLAANEKFIIPKFNRYLIFILIFFMPRFFINCYNYTIKSSFNSRIVINLYEYLNRSTLLFLIFYLLITIICVVKLVKFERGPLVGRL